MGPTRAPRRAGRTGEIPRRIPSRTPRAAPTISPTGTVTIPSRMSRARAALSTSRSREREGKSGGRGGVGCAFIALPDGSCPEMGASRGRAPQSGLLTVRRKEPGVQSHGWIAVTTRTARNRSGFGTAARYPGTTRHPGSRSARSPGRSAATRPQRGARPCASPPTRSTREAFSMP